MARKVLEIFLSSTAQDLAPHREAVYERLRRVEFFHCVRQEDFGAQDSDALDFCCKKAQAADLFIGLIGMRRGWEPEGDNAKRSITEMEYDRAREAGRRRFVYASPDSFPVPGNLRETSAEHKRLLAFRKRIMGERIVSQKGFDTPELFASEVVERLLAHVIASDLIGELHPEFVRKDMDAVEAQGPAVTAAVERLAEDEDVDLLALAKNPGNVDLADLESKLKTRAETHESEGRSSLRTSAQYWRHIGALAFLHNTHKALAAYEKAVALDPSEPEGWRYLGELQYRLGDIANADRSFTHLAELGKSTNDPRTQSMGCLRLGWIAASYTGDLAKAETLIIDALRLAESATWQEGVARAYANLGNVYDIRGDPGKAEEMQYKALVLDEELGDKEGMATAYGNLGNIHQSRDDLDKAEEMLCKALALHEELSDKEGMATAYGNLGNLHQSRGDFDKAEQMQCKALVLDEELGRKEGMAAASGNLGNIHQSRGDLDKAEQMQRKALALHEELGHKEGMATAYGNLGIIHQSRGDLDKAEQMQRKALALYQEAAHKGGIATACVHLGILHQSRGDFDKAEEMHCKALTLNEELGRKSGMATACVHLGIIHQSRGDFDKAEQMHCKAPAVYEELGRKDGIAATCGNLGIVHLSRGDFDKAEQMHRKALTLNEELGRKDGMATACGHLGIIHQSRGDFDKAEEMHCKALTLNDELGRKDGMAAAYSNLGIIYRSKNDKSAMCRCWRDARNLYREMELPDRAAEVHEWLKSNECGDG
jgi:tetratricopeptide (TPR) repeat protein